MHYLHSTFKALKGNLVRVTVDQPTRVLLLDRNQFKNYKDSKTFQYRGGHIEDQETEFLIPKNGEWHVVVELGQKSVKKSIQASVEKFVVKKK